MGNNVTPGAVWRTGGLLPPAVSSLFEGLVSLFPSQVHSPHTSQHPVEFITDYQTLFGIHNLPCAPVHGQDDKKYCLENSLDSQILVAQTSTGRF